MVVKHTIQIGDPVLRERSKKIKPLVLGNRRIVQNLIDSMRANGLVGMAAPQIGIPKRIFVSEIRKTKTRRQVEVDAVRVFINPVIESLSKKKTIGFEGCGSVAHAGIFVKVSRSETVKVTAYNERGKEFTLTARGLLARIIQHEIDHLNGVMFLDRASDIRSVISRAEYIKRLS